MESHSRFPDEQTFAIEEASDAQQKKAGARSHKLW